MDGGEYASYGLDPLAAAKLLKGIRLFRHADKVPTPHPTGLDLGPQIPDDILKLRQAEVVTDRASATFGKVPVEIPTSSGYVIQPIEGQTTTILGRWNVDMDGIINTRLEYPKTADFGAKPGGYNVLNVDTDLAGDQFWETYNKPFLDAAMSRNDRVVLATVPSEPLDVMTLQGTPTGMFGRELQHLVQSDYRPVNISPAQWSAIKGWYD